MLSVRNVVKIMHIPDLYIGHIKLMTDQALKPDLSIVDCQIPECRTGKRGALAVIG